MQITLKNLEEKFQKGEIMIKIRSIQLCDMVIRSVSQSVEYIFIRNYFALIYNENFAYLFIYRYIANGNNRWLDIEEMLKIRRNYAYCSIFLNDTRFIFVIRSITRSNESIFSFFDTYSIAVFISKI